MKPVRKSIGGLGNLMFKQAYIYSQMRRGLIPDIYVQSDKYWKEFTEEVKLMFSPGGGIIDMVSLHIRRGDYLDTDFYVDLTQTDYYKEAVKQFPDEEFIVFYRDRQDDSRDQDDAGWCIEYLDRIIPGRYRLYSGEDETDDLNMMARCKSNIMANSSFSWWAAFLNNNPNRKVVCPKDWFSDGVMRIDLLDEWIEI